MLGPQILELLQQPSFPIKQFLCMSLFSFRLITASMQHKFGVNDMANINERVGHSESQLPQSGVGSRMIP